MRKTFRRLAAGLTATATLSSMLLAGAPAHAAQPTSTKDTLTRQAINATSTHTLVSTLPSFSTNSTIVFDYGTSGFTLFDSSPSGSCGSGTCTATTTGTSTTVLCTSGPCSGAISYTFAGVNPSSAGSKTISITSSDASGISGSFAVPITDSDQVTVTAAVNASITFDIDTATTDTNSNAPYSVALGTLTTGAVSGSNESSINSIWLDLDTNASGGAVVTVSSTNSSLKSTSTPADTIPSANGTMAAGTANYGLCIKSITQTTGTLAKVAPFNGATCTSTPAGNVVGGLTGSAQDILNTSNVAIAAGRAEIMVDAAINGTTNAHSDYTDTLKFIATGTF